MALEEIFRFVSIRSPRLVLPDPADRDPPSHPAARAEVDNEMVAASAHAATPEEARYVVANRLRSRDDALTATPDGMALLKAGPELATTLSEAKSDKDAANLIKVALEQVLKSEDGERFDGELQERSEQLRTQVWLHYYAGLLDPESVSFHEEVLFWIRIFHLLDHIGSAEFGNLIKRLETIYPGIEPDLLVVQGTGKGRTEEPPDRSTQGKAHADTAATDIIERCNRLKVLHDKLIALQADKLAEMERLTETPMEWQFYPEEPSTQDRAGAEPEAVGNALVRPPADYRSPWRLSLHDFSDTERALLIDVGLWNAGAFLPELITGIEQHLAQLAAGLVDYSPKPAAFGAGFGRGGAARRTE